MSLLISSHTVSFFTFPFLNLSFSGCRCIVTEVPQVATSMSFVPVQKLLFHWNKKRVLNVGLTAFQILVGLNLLRLVKRNSNQQVVQVSMLITLATIEISHFDL